MTEADYYMNLGKSSKTLAPQTDAVIINKFPELSEELMVVLNTDGNVIYINRKGCIMLGYQEEAIIGQNWFNNFIPLDAKDRAKNDLAKLLTGEELQWTHLIHPILTEEGKIQSIEWNYLPVKDRESGNISLLCAGRTAVEKEPNDCKYQSIYDNYRTMVENTSDGIIIIQERTIKFTNKGTTEILGYSREEFTRCNIMELVAPGSQKVVKKRYASWLKGGEIPSLCKIELTAKDGTILPTEVKMNRICFNGRSAYLVFIRDLTESEQAGKNLMEMQSHFKNLFNLMVDPVAIVDHRGKFLEVSASLEKFCEIRREDLLGKYFINTPVVTARSKAIMAKNLAKRMMGKIIPPYEIEVLCNGTRKMPVELNACKIEYMGQPADLVVFRNISDRKAVEKELQKSLVELERSNRELEQFAYIASHDLQEPLRMVTSFTQLLASRYKGKLGEDADEFIYYAVDGATRMQQLINDLLLYSRVGTKTKSFTPTNCEQVLEQIIANLQIVIEENGAIITHDPLPTIQADETQMGQLFQNLIGNAIKFHGDTDPRVHIKARQITEGWEFSIRDNGIGIPHENAERIFQIFQRLHERDKYDGTGIGLAVCKRIVEQHGGEIRVKSKPGKSTTFIFTIKIEEDSYYEYSHGRETD